MVKQRRDSANTLALRRRRANAASRARRSLLALWRPSASRGRRREAKRENKLGEEDEMEYRNNYPERACLGCDRIRPIDWFVPKDPLCWKCRSARVDCPSHPAEEADGIVGSEEEHSDARLVLVDGIRDCPSAGDAAMAIGGRAEGMRRLARDATTPIRDISSDTSNKPPTERTTQCSL